MDLDGSQITAVKLINQTQHTLNHPSYSCSRPAADCQLSRPRCPSPRADSDQPQLQHSYFQSPRPRVLCRGPCPVCLPLCGQGRCRHRSRVLARPRNQRRRLCVLQRVNVLCACCFWNFSLAAWPPLGMRAVSIAEEECDGGIRSLVWTYGVLEDMSTTSRDYGASRSIDGFLGTEDHSQWRETVVPSSRPIFGSDAP